MFVYLITNTINGKRYVGQTTTSLEKRWGLHQKVSHCRYLHAAIKKHGAANFTIEAICEPPTIESMNEFEAEYIIRYNTLAPNGYNLTTGGRVPRHHADTLKKISDSSKGNRPPSSFSKNWTPEMREAAKQHAINMWKDPERKARAAQKKSGVSNCNSKLTLEQIQEIRRLYSTGEYSQAKLAEMFPTSQSAVSDIVSNRRYPTTNFVRD